MPLAKPDFNQDKVVGDLERGHRANQILALGVGTDLQKKREQIYRYAENQLVAGTLTPDLAFTHIACANALRRFEDDLNDDIKKAQRAADRLRAETEPETQDENL